MFDKCCISSAAGTDTDCVGGKVWKNLSRVVMEVNAKNMLVRILQLVHQIHSSLNSDNIPQCSVSGNIDIELKTQNPEKKRSSLTIFTLVSKVHSTVNSSVSISKS